VGAQLKRKHVRPTRGVGRVRHLLIVACIATTLASFGCAPVQDASTHDSAPASEVTLDEDFDPIDILTSRTGAIIVETDAPSDLTVAQALAESATLWSSAQETSATIVVKKGLFSFAPDDERASSEERLAYLIGIRPIWANREPKYPSGYIEEVLVIDANTGGLIEAWQQVAGTE